MIEELDEMRDQSQCNFAGQDLRNRSFARQDLSGAVFSGADLRGCNFRKACLVGATFNRAQLGCSGFQHSLRLGLIFCVALVMMDAVSRLIFAGLGKTWEDPTWPLVALLQSVLLSAGLTSTVAFLTQHRRRHLARWCAGWLNGALIGFCYGGYFTNSNPGKATFGAIIGVLVVTALIRFVGHQPWVMLSVWTASTIALYGFTFFVEMWAIAAWSTAHYLLAFGLSILGLGALWLTGHQVLQLLADLKTFPGNFFQGADLTDATFEDAIFGCTNIDLESWGKRYL
jgi:Pentapeptide repeats (8 copies)